MNKVLKIVLMFALVGVFSVVTYFIFGTVTVQHKYESKQPKSTTQVVEKKQERVKNNLAMFLEKPIDLLQFKKSKAMSFTTSFTNRFKYYFNPKIKKGVFYVYNYPNLKKKGTKANQFIVFKHGENKHSYEDSTEILVEFKIFYNDVSLGKANLHGFTKKEIESEFGTDYLTFQNKTVYSYKNKVLILEFENSKVEMFNYIKLNSEEINIDLIEQIVKNAI